MTHNDSPYRHPEESFQHFPCAVIPRLPLKKGSRGNLNEMHFTMFNIASSPQILTSFLRKDSE